MRIRTSEIAGVLTLLLLLSAAQPANAQLTRGYVSGTVTDTSNGILAGVQVTLTNKATNASREIPANDTGFYRFVAVEPGDYSIAFQLTGFENRKVDNITVKTAQEVVVNQILGAAGGAIQVTVLGTPGAELLKTTPTVERTLEERVVAELPMQIFNGVRDISRLALLAPTVTRASSFTEFSANGQRSRNNNFILDGADNNDLSVTLNSLRIIPEAVGEVQIQTSSYSAEFGNRSGAQVSAITKSGTNSYRGEVWEYYRGNWMEPLSVTNKRAGITATPRFVLNQFGADLGGPIFKDRTFFFGLLEANRRREAPAATNAASATIPTPAGYAALSNVPLGPGQTVASRQGVLSALSFLSEVHAQVGNYQSVQNLPIINGVPIQKATIRLPFARPSNFWYNVARIDHRLSENDNLTYRYHLDRSDQPNLTGNGQFGSRFTAAQSIRRQNHAVSYTRIFNSRFLNEARLTYTRGRLAFPENDPLSSTVNITGFFTIGGLAAFPQGRLEQVYQLQDIATHIAGRNSLKFGLDVRRNRLFARFGVNSKGTWTFSNLTEFLNNTAFSVVQAVNESSFDSDQWNHAYFFQDDVKITKDFTLNLGLRYESSTVPLGFFGATDPAVRAVGIPGPARPDKNNWAPRIGFAYSPDARTSMRGGFGVSYDVLFYGILANAASNYPRVMTSTRTGAAAANLFPALPGKVSTTTLDPLTTTFVNVPEDSQNPTTHFWNLSVQREFNTNYLIELGYAGNRSHHQLRQRDANPGVLTATQAARVIATGIPAQAGVQRLNPNWGPRNVIDPAAKGEYHAGYVKFDKRMSKGLLIGANYTWSASFSDNDEAFGANDIVTSSPQVPQDFFNYHNEWSRSAFDRPHRLAFHYIYDIPSPAAEGVLNHVFGGWAISGVTDLQSGQPFTIRTGIDTVGTMAAAFPGRPNYNPNGIMLKDPDTEDLRTFTIPANDTGIVVAPRHSVTNAILANSMPGGGNLGRNTFRGPSFQNWNFSVMKRVAIAENLNIQLRSDFVNAWNHNNFQNPIAAMASPTFGQNTATLLTDARQILLSAKIRF